MPLFHGGPYRGWSDRFYEGDPHPTFAKLSTHRNVVRHTGIRQIMHSFPQKTTLIGLTTPAGVVIIEGMHRSSALALAYRWGNFIETDVRIALAPDDREILPMLESVKK